MKKAFLMSSFILLTVFAGLSFADSIPTVPPPVQTKGTLAVKVSDEAGKAIFGARVLIDSMTVLYTDSLGKCSAMLAPKAHLVMVSKKGYMPVSKTGVVVTSNATTNLAITLKKAVVVIGTVVSGTKPLDSARVYLRKYNKRVDSTRTTSKGEYSFDIDTTVPKIDTLRPLAKTAVAGEFSVEVSNVIVPIAPISDMVSVTNITIGTTSVLPVNNLSTADFSLSIQNGTLAVKTNKQGVLKMVSMDGKTVFSGRTDAYQLNASFALTGMKNGCYVVQFNTGSRTLARKVMIKN